MPRSVIAISYDGGDDNTYPSMTALCSDSTIWISYVDRDNTWSAWKQLPSVPGTEDSVPERINITPTMGGKPIRCHCGCRVFHTPKDAPPSVYECNNCGAWYEGTPKSKETHP
jgi:hypothetical protein